MSINGRWWESTKDLWALDKFQRANFMILLRGPYKREEIAQIIGVKKDTVYGWERRWKTPRLDHLRAMLTHFTGWYLKDGLPESLSVALGEITGKKPLTITSARLKRVASVK